MGDVIAGGVMAFMGGIGVIISIFSFLKEQKLKNLGKLVEATCTGSSKETSASYPMFGFWYGDAENKKYYKIVAKVNSSIKIGEKVSVYINPDKPDKEYYMPKKEFMGKYVTFFVGSFFVCLGLFYVFRHSENFKEIYFLYLMLSLFVGTLILYLIGKIKD